jgi:DNA helicase HerA-like ATPase
VTPDEPIVVDDHVRHAEKHVAARFVSDALGRLDKTGVAEQKASLSPDSIPPETMPLTLGLLVDDTGRRLGPVAFPLARMVHIYVSGTTGSGKSFLARVLVEEAAQHKQLSILVLDPRNQSIGLLLPEERPRILQQYEEFGVDPKRARGFGFDYFAPGLPFATGAPQDLAALARGRSVVSFKGLDDQRRCALAGQILDAIFEACNAQESENPRLLVVVDEAQLFTRKRLDESAKQAAARAERALDRIAREGRKFGIVLALVSQTIKDFSYELANIRQMATTKIFLRNSDREIEYAADIIGDGRLLVQLPTGTALVHNANWGAVRVRPPYSKVFELGEADVRRLVGRDKEPSKTLSAEAQKLFAMISEHGSLPAQPLNMSRAANLAGISSKRKFLEVSELEWAAVVRTKRLIDRGRPRIIELTESPHPAGDDPRRG